MLAGTASIVCYLGHSCPLHSFPVGRQDRSIAQRAMHEIGKQQGHLE